MNCNPDGILQVWKVQCVSIPNRDFDELQSWFLSLEKLQNPGFNP